ncbi:hypothetical protein SNR37_000347 [Agarivorans aestuarii]|uniref:Uncharacterized protein n=1 Tax=Agarivorans aestuarii TaxID=1563703 RepID=A0ABU7G997_9ALTE|nr:hypothetical protein [Agarivorans aestuarii]MEE1675025.1 hypothetical protein [Agarivorans aestuarii]
MTKFNIVVLLYWVSLSSAATDLSCLGSEPFWSLNAKGKHIEFSDINDQTIAFELSATLASLNHTNRWIIQGDGSQADTITISLSKTEQCSDDMSDFTYEYDVAFVMGEKVFSGCCNRMK